MLPAPAPASGVTLHVPVLMYHLVAGPPDHEAATPGLEISPALFAAQLDALDRAGWRTITLATLAHDLAAGARPPTRTMVLTFDDGHADGYTHVLPELERHGFVATFFVITDRIDRPGYLSSDDLRAMMAAGMEIGDHTVDHLDLTTLTDAGIRRELGAAADRIAGVTGIRPTTVAYPAGRVDGRVVAIARQLGFAMGVTTQPGARESSASPLLVPRLRVTPDTTPNGLVTEVNAA